MEHDNRHDSFESDTAYCWDFNSDGYCKTCGKRRMLPTADQQIVEWPKRTWFQNRRALVLEREAFNLKGRD